MIEPNSSGELNPLGVALFIQTYSHFRRLNKMRHLVALLTAWYLLLPTTCLANETSCWSVSEEAASKAVLDKYPGILQGAYLFGPTVATLKTDIPSFARSGEKVWHVRIHCNKGGPHALFFVHPETGKVYTIMRPGEKDSVRCN